MPRRIAKNSEVPAADHAGAGVFVELFDESEQAPVDTDPLGGVTGVDFL